MTRSEQLTTRQRRAVPVCVALAVASGAALADVSQSGEQRNMRRVGASDHPARRFADQPVTSDQHRAIGLVAGRLGAPSHRQRRRMPARVGRRVRRSLRAPAHRTAEAAQRHRAEAAQHRCTASEGRRHEGRQGGHPDEAVRNGLIF